MGGSALEFIQKQVEQNGSVPIDLELGYKVLYSTLAGNLPINHAVSGEICGLPVNLELNHRTIPNTQGNFPVNTGFSGTIGDTPVKADMPYKIVFSLSAGNIPVNTAVEWKTPEGKSLLNMSYTMVPAFARGGNAPGGGEKVHKGARVIFTKGVLKLVEGGGGGGGTSCEAGRPVCNTLKGRIGNLEIDCRFVFSYFVNTGSGRNPINTRLVGEIHKVQ